MSTTYTDAITTIDNIVEGMFLKSDLPEGYEAKMKQIAIEGYREMNIVALSQGRATEKFTMDSNYIVYMPDDMMLVNRVAVPYNGEMWFLTLERDMVPTTSESGGQEILDPDWGEGEDIIKRGVFYAARGGVNTEGYYFPDYVKRRILFRNVNRSEVLISYMHSGIDKTETTYIPTFAKPGIEAYVRLYLEYNKTVPNANIITIYRDEYERQKTICRGIKFNLTDWMDAVYRTFSASIYR
jgi:hypothetical protein